MYAITVIDTNVYKLATKDDPIHIHKMLGIIALCNFIYRYYLLFMYKSMFLHTPTSYLMLVIHACLSVSSLIFHISQNRHLKLPMIYPEFRMHSIVFALRSIVCCVVHTINIDGSYTLYITMGACILTMIAADLITRHYKFTSATTTMRAMPYPTHIPIEEQLKITDFYSVQQISATLFMLLNAETAFSPLFAIQIAPFLMTLVRKGIITSYTWHILYSLALLINIWCLITVSYSSIIMITIIAWVFVNVRRRIRVSKYMLWIAMFIMYILGTMTVNRFIHYYVQFIVTYSLILAYFITNGYELRRTLVPKRFM
jgi:hypothetical protein